MPLDQNSEDESVLGKDLKPGDCVRSTLWTKYNDGNDMGIIVATTFFLDEAGKKLKKFYQNKPAYEIYEINCPHDGAFTTRLNPDKIFKVIKSRKDILYTYKTIEYELLKRSADLINQRNDLMKIRTIAVERMNDRCDKLKTKNKGE